MPDPLFDRDHHPMAERYLALALRLGKLAPGLVEGYVGPPRLSAQVDAEAPPSARMLRQEVAELHAALEGYDLEPDRRAWVSSQLEALDTALAYLDGEQFSYRELVQRCHGVAPTLVSEEQFAAAHDHLREMLPGAGDLRERYRRWAATQLVDPDLLLPGLRAMSAQLQRRTRERFGLPLGEEVIFELVRDKPWSGYADYLGSFRTRIQINEDRPIRSFRLLELVSHEAYPGHHTEHVLKDAHLIQDRGRLELGIYVYPTPQALVAEGIADLAIEALLDDRADEVAAECLRPLGIAYDPETASAHGQAAMMLRPLRANIAILLDEGISTVEARAYARRWMLEDDQYVDTALDSLLSRRWRPYESCYPEGFALCRRFSAGDPNRFKRLLQEQLTPADLLTQ